MVATSVAFTVRPVTNTNDMAFYLALINLAIADAAIAAWTAKYLYHIARPVTYIRQFDPNGITLGTLHRHWTPQGGPDSNGPLSSLNFTPPFPSYPSGHATFGGALFQTMRLFFNAAQTGEPRFQFVSDEYNVINKDAFGKVLVVRNFASFTAAEFENARSRIWNGIHWQFDADAGVSLGNLVANIVFAEAFT